MKIFKNKLTSKKGKLNGGFTSLCETQLNKIKGGIQPLKKDLNGSLCWGGNPASCSNTTCGSNDICTS